MEYWNLRRMTQKLLTIAIGSLGVIGLRVAQGIVQNPGLGRLVAVAARDADRATVRLCGIKSDAKVVAPADLAKADVVIECAPASAFRDIALPAIEAGRTLIPATVSGLLAHPDLIARARETGARIVVPTGAIAALDAVRAMARGVLSAASLKTTKNPHSLAGAPFFDSRDFDPEAIAEPTLIFSGNTLDAASAFPANVNVAAALALAGIGPERTQVEIWADPYTRINTHQISVISDAAELDLTIRVLPSPDNPKSSLLTPLSLLAALEGLNSGFRVGS